MQRLITAGVLLGVMLGTAAPAAVADPPQSESDSSSQSPRGLGRLFGLTASGWSVGVGHYTPTQVDRNIDVTTVDFSRAWRFWQVLEVQRRLGVFHSNGKRTDVPADGSSPNSTATGATFGAGLRLYPINRGFVRPFVEGSAQILYSPGHVFPAGGTGVNGFERAGAGVMLELNPQLAMEAGYQWYSHVSNGSGLSPQNPMWNGHGGTIALRWQL